jgi:hypothetical protein
MGSAVKCAVVSVSLARSLNKNAHSKGTVFGKKGMITNCKKRRERNATEGSYGLTVHQSRRQPQLIWQTLCNRHGALFLGELFSPFPLSLWYPLWACCILLYLGNLLLKGQTPTGVQLSLLDTKSRCRETDACCFKARSCQSSSVVAPAKRSPWSSSQMTVSVFSIFQIR